MTKPCQRQANAHLVKELSEYQVFVGGLSDNLAKSAAKFKIIPSIIQDN